MMKKGHFKIQIQIALIKPGLLSPLKTTSVLSGPDLHTVTTLSLWAPSQFPLLQAALAVPPTPRLL